MKTITILAVGCITALIVAMLPLPLAYYTWLRILVSIGAMIIVFQEVNRQRRRWSLPFLATAIVFNPVIPVYLYKKELWVLVDTGAAMLFIMYIIFANLLRRA